MKLFFDTEFTGLTQNTSLISLAIVDENDRTFYAEFTDYDQSQVDEWLEDNVIASLWLENPGEEIEENRTLVKGAKEQITSSLRNWLDAYKSEGCQFVADVLMYDWVLFAELFGGALSLPEYVDYMPLDFASILYLQGLSIHTPRIELLDTSEVELLKRKSSFDSQHNALYDAYLLKLCFEKVMKVAA